MNLTSDQKKAIDEGLAVPVVVEHIECVLVRRDVYERAREIVETYPAVLEAWDAEGSPRDADTYADFGRKE